MNNLAGIDHARVDATVRDELTRARIPIVEVERSNGEVASAVEGLLAGVKFTRAWYYWIAHGVVPLDVAKALYADPEGKISVRVAGHCACPPPEDPWIEYVAPNGRKVLHGQNNLDEYERAKVRRAEGETGFLGSQWANTVEAEFVVSLNPLDVEGVKAFIDTYHIDNQAGLRLFADAIGKMEGK